MNALLKLSQLVKLVLCQDYSIGLIDVQNILSHLPRLEYLDFKLAQQNFSEPNSTTQTQLNRKLHIIKVVVENLEEKELEQLQSLILGHEHLQVFSLNVNQRFKISSLEPFLQYQTSHLREYAFQMTGTSTDRQPKFDFSPTLRVLDLNLSSNELKDDQIYPLYTSLRRLTNLSSLRLNLSKNNLTIKSL